MPDIQIDSSIRAVTVYASGAVIRREAALPALAGGEQELRLSGLPLSMDPGSVRAAVTGRDVVGLLTRIVVPPAPPPRTGLEERMTAVGREISRLEAERDWHVSLRDVTSDATLEIGLRNRRNLPDPLARAADVLTTNALISELALPHDDAARRLDAAIADTRREFDALELEWTQARSAAEAGRPASREVVVRLAGDGPVEVLLLEYVVHAARWWPAYTARLAQGGVAAAWSIEAFVAQASGEDWTGVRLSVATSDLVRDVRLPTLPSMRLGRAQPPAKKGYRPAPAGLDELFAGYDRVRVAAPRVQTLSVKPPPPPPREERVRKRAVRPDRDEEREYEASLDEGEAREEKKSMKSMAPPPPPPPSPMPQAPMRSAGRAPGAPPPVPAMAMAPSRSLAKKEAQAPMAKGAAGGAGFDVDDAEPLQEPTGAIEPQEAWLDFDQLVLANGDAGAGRGKLGRASGAAPQGASVEHVGAPPLCRDPRETRGMFDHRYDSAAPCDVPSTAQAHRVTLATAEAKTTPRLVVVPRETTEVFRSAESQNPFDAPLVPGPVDVFIDGSLVTTAPLDAVDRGGTVTLPIGLEERVRVARNVRQREETAGLLGGSTAVFHDVTIELSSALGFPVTVEVRERLPVTDDKELEIALVSAKPPHEKYDQADRGAPLRGGARWKVALAPGAKVLVEYSYRMNFSAKSEVAGGNRRG